MEKVVGTLIILAALCYVGVSIARWFGVTNFKPSMGKLGGVIPSGKAKNGAIAALVAIAIAGAALVYWGSATIIQFGTTYWPWMLGALVVMYLVLKERGFARALVGTALVLGTVAAIIIGTHSQLTTGSMVPNGCSDEPVVVQTAQTTDDGTGGNQLSLSGDCEIRLDLDLMRLAELKEGKTEFQPHVIRATTNSKKVMRQSEASLYGVSQIEWVSGRPMMKVIPKKAGFETIGETSIELLVVTPEQADSIALMKRALAGETQ